MKITLRDIVVKTSDGIESSERPCVLATVVMQVFGDCYEESDVDLIDFYEDSKTAITDALLSNINSDISVYDEPMVRLVQHEDGILAKNILVGNPAFSSIEYEELSLEDIRQFLSEIETELASHLVPFRNEFIQQFERSGAKEIFNLLKLIDRSNVIHLS